MVPSVAVLQCKSRGEPGDVVGWQRQGVREGKVVALFRFADAGGAAAFGGMEEEVDAGVEGTGGVDVDAGFFVALADAGIEQPLVRSTRCSARAAKAQTGAVNI